VANIPNPGASLLELQRYVSELCEERGFGEEAVSQKFMLLAEEVGEFAKAARKQAGLAVATDAQHQDLNEEAGDVLTIFLDLCNKLEINVDEAFRRRQETNQTRTWE